ncbi:MAG TPA: molybdopterin cofactor-binding domain-containing protein [Bryobacteraceae bacterium]|nr:molybdopterin cofactor-binding domain-containing protein [Bryobacteraceae bacterium]
MNPLDRREFLAAVGGGPLVTLTVDAQRRGGRPMPQDVAAWLHIGQDGAVTVYTGKVEMGQNVRTSLAQAVAEELHAPMTSVRMVMGDTAMVPYDAGTFGSQSTPVMSPQLRRAAATAREMLVDLAAERWGADRAKLSVSDGKVTDGTRSAAFGDLTRGQKLVKSIAAETPLTPAAQWKVAGKSLPKVNGRDFVTGRHQYTSDLKRPGMLHGKVLRPPAIGATLATFDGSTAEAIAGVTVVRDGSFAGVTAPDPQMAEKALAALRATWRKEPQPSGAELFDYLRKNGEAGSGPSRGSLAEGLAAADRKFAQTYTAAYIAHVPLEPRAAVAEWEGTKLTVWTGTQRPFGVRGELSTVFNLPEDQVRVIMPDTGSGYGGKHSGECAIEAARLAKAAGKPVRLVWTREEEFQWAYLRPAAVIDVASGLRKDGSITAWDFHNYNSGTAGIQTMYDIPHQRIEYHPSKSPLRQGSYRALAATANHFARETHMDELARELGIDPLEFRLKNLKDARFRAVLAAVAERIGWARRKPAKGRGFGIAGGFEKAGYVATAVELEADAVARKVQLLRVVEAFDCGAAINPEHLRNQIEGAIVMGIGGALFERIEFDQGRILNGRMARYRVPRFSDVPPIETILMDRRDLQPVGAGETPIVGIAPAIGNAIFDATGKRLRSLPLTL